MKKIEFIMGMPVIIETPENVKEVIFKKVFDYFRYVDEKFSPYKATSEVTKINDKRIKDKFSKEMKEILDLSEKTKKETNGYFNIYQNGFIDPSGIVKGWAIYNASKILDELKVKNYYVEASGDIQTKGKTWTVGIKNPFSKNEIVKVLHLKGEGIATSGTYEKGNHIYNPNGILDDEIISLTVIAPNVYEADRYATSAFAMGKDGIHFLESIAGLEGYMINRQGIATMTSGLDKYVIKNR